MSSHPAEPPAGAASELQAAEAATRLVPLGLLFVLVVHYPSWVGRRSSLAQYFTGVYRSRVLAREMILGIANGVDRLVGMSGRDPSPGFVAGWVTVTGGGFLLSWWLLRRLVRGRASPTGAVEVVLAAAMAASATVLTPYDFLSYALILATVTAALSGRTVLTAGLAAAAVATRESGLLAVAIIVSAHVAGAPVGARSLPERYREWARASLPALVRCRPLWAATAAGVTTYAALKIGFRPGAGVTLFQPAPLHANLTPRTTWSVGLAVVLTAGCRWAVRPAGGTLRLRRRVLWCLAVPYLAVLAVGSAWGEAPRLVMPLVLGEAVLALAPVSRVPR